MISQNKAVSNPTPPEVISSWRDARLLVTDEFESPPVILKVEDSVVGTLGNFSASTGKAKSKKTFNVCAIVAAALTNGTVLNYSASLPPGKGVILYADTEQSDFHCKRVLSRILRLAGLSLDVHPSNLVFLCLRKFATKDRLKKIEEAIYEIDGLGLVIIVGIRDLAHDINSPGESTDLITKLMQWTDERKIHIHTVLHLNKGDDNTRGHLGTELNNKAETVLQITKDDLDKDISCVSSSHIRDRDFEPFAFRINSEALPEPAENYQPRQSTAKGFDYAEVSETKHREALELLFSEADRVSYSCLIGKLQTSYASICYSIGINKAKKLKTFLENKRMIIKEDKHYRYNPDFVY
ncbi:MAG: AAA family ATPase [Rikenellaceae bacterium]|nr:AAA family ATPase [Rikenellaceae bacterium]